MGALVFDEIEKIVTMTPGGDFEDGVYVAWPVDPNEYEFYFLLSTENTGDQVFMQKLNAKLNPPEIENDMPTPTMGQ